MHAIPLSARTSPPLGWPQLLSAYLLRFSGLFLWVVGFLVVMMLLLSVAVARASEGGIDYSYATSWVIVGLAGSAVLCMIGSAMGAFGSILGRWVQPPPPSRQLLWIGLVTLRDLFVAVGFTLLVASVIAMLAPTVPILESGAWLGFATGMIVTAFYANRSMNRLAEEPLPA